MKSFTTSNENVSIFNENSLDCYEKWGTPIVIICDGPYGISGFDGDLPTRQNLGEWYEPHIIQWTKKSTPETTLWFWGTELGWVNVHPYLEKHGWRFINSHVWNKGLGHVAGNANTKSLRKLPIVTEICVQYSKIPLIKKGKKNLTLKEWLRDEWVRTGLPLTQTNIAAGVKDAATRKYFTQCHLWYPPPPDIFTKIVDYANNHGNKEGAPYFSIDGKRSLNSDDWKRMRPKFHCPFGVTNVWDAPPLNGDERIKIGLKAFHLNQKPLKLTKLIIEITSDKGDIVWEPFAGLATGGVASYILDRKCYCAEINSKIFDKAVERLKIVEKDKKLKQTVLLDS